MMMDRHTRLTLLPQTTAIFRTSNDQDNVTATRFGSASRHEFIVIVIAESSVVQIFGPIGPAIKRNLGLIRRWSERESVFSKELLSPPVCREAERAWYLAKALEMLSLYLYHQPSEEPQLFCSMIKKNAHRYVKEALALLEARLDQPLNLSQLANDVGCASHYLSRLVKLETGKTLLLHLRAMRIEKAAELLSNRQFNITEVAYEVGYQSLSHFSKAFSLEKGMTPSRFQKR